MNESLQTGFQWNIHLIQQSKKKNRFRCCIKNETKLKEKRKTFPRLDILANFLLLIKAESWQKGAPY